MKLVIFLLLCSLFSSCLTARRIERNCDLFAKLCGTQTIIETKYKDTTVYFDRMVPVLLPHDTAQLKGSIFINSHGAQMDPISTKSGIISLKGEIKNSKFEASAYVNKDSLITHLKDSITLVIKETFKNATIPMVEKKIPGFYQFTFWLFIVEVIAIILYSIFGRLPTKKSLS